MVTNRDPDGLASQNNQLNYEVIFCKIDAIKKIIAVYNAHLEIINIYAIVMILCLLVIEKKQKNIRPSLVAGTIAVLFFKTVNCFAWEFNFQRKLSDG